MYNQNPILDLSTPEHFKRNIQKFLAEILEIPEYSINDRTPVSAPLCNGANLTVSNGGRHEHAQRGFCR